MHFYSQKNIQKLEEYLWVKKNPGIHEINLLEKVSHYNTYFQKIPGILGIAVCNSLAMNSAHKDSDIDLFIITKNNRIWTVRILMTLLLILLRQRKTSKHHAWKFCLSFFITEKWLDFKNIVLENDLYLAYWVDTLRLIINRNNIFEQFKNTNQALIQFSPKERNETSKRVSVQKNTYFCKFLTRLWDVCEKLFKFILIPKTKKSFQKLWKPFWVVITNDMLKFHVKDKRKEIRDIIFS